MVHSLTAGLETIGIKGGLFSDIVELSTLSSNHSFVLFSCSFLYIYVCWHTS